MPSMTIDRIDEIRQWCIDTLKSDYIGIESGYAFKEEYDYMMFKLKLC
jgi:hypothetical protein